ncbi:MAG: hypothetical protein EHM80_10640 [Nitrospiraceae bacterium]|nr:MAG: hypothetical protein EHM80_10640 [Nitrospiraceae bacterium]
MLSIAALAAIGLGAYFLIKLTGGLRFKRSPASQDAQSGIPARPQGARRLKRTRFSPAHPELPRQLDHPGGTLQGDG